MNTYLAILLFSLAVTATVLIMGKFDKKKPNIH